MSKYRNYMERVIIILVLALIAVCAVVSVWIVASWIEVIAKNATENPVYNSLNFFQAVLAK